MIATVNHADIHLSSIGIRQNLLKTIIAEFLIDFYHHCTNQLSKWVSLLNMQSLLQSKQKKKKRYQVMNFKSGSYKKLTLHNFVL